VPRRGWHSLNNHEFRNLKAMFAVIKTGGKQYRVSPRDVIEVERLSSPAGEVVELTDVLAMSRDDGLKLGQPLVAGARVAATVLEHRRAEKIIVFRKLRRKNYRRTRGHRQNQTVLRIEEILADGETFTPPKPELKKKVAPAKKKAATKKRAKPAGEVTAENAAKPKAEAKKPAAEKNAPAKSESDAPAADTSKDEETS